ncbi:UNVERIFIED_CONTAM: hypothetical protein GTU68_062339 [Idotea baltica]|nr:hypothetical protein [Idotea baltica]
MESRLHVAILTGGPSAERSVSERSAKLVADHLNPEKYSWRLIHVDADGWFEDSTRQKMDQNDFSLIIEGKRETFDFVFLMIHGTPAEDGKIQGYLEMKNLPHSTCDTLSASLSFNKQKCKDFLRSFNIPLAASIILRRSSKIRMDEILKLGLPMFIKPNCNGSSYGISKVKSEADVRAAIEHAFEYDDEVIIESFLEGREFGCGVVKERDVLHAFPITEIIPKAEFFTYEAKYEGASEEITPATISQELSVQCQDRSKEIYERLACRGVVRFDYILVGDIFYLLEANTIPGMSPASIIPQQATSYGWTISHLLDVIIENCIG